MKAHRLLYHSTLGLRVIKKKKRLTGSLSQAPTDAGGEEGGSWAAGRDDSGHPTRGGVESSEAHEWLQQLFG